MFQTLGCDNQTLFLIEDLAYIPVPVFSTRGAYTLSPCCCQPLSATDEHRPPHNTYTAQLLSVGCERRKKCEHRRRM